MKKIRVGILGVAAAAALCFTAGAVYLYARGVWQMPIPADRALPVLMYHHIVEDGEPCNDMTITVSRMEQDLRWLTEQLRAALPAASGIPDESRGLYYGVYAGRVR